VPTKGKTMHERVFVDGIGTAMRSSFGVEFEDQVAREFALQALRQRTITPKDALAGKDIFANMNQNQRKAIVAMHSGQLEISKAVTERLKEVEEYIKKLPQADQEKLNKDARFKLGIDALHTIQESVQGKRTSEAERFVGKGIGAYYDGLFALNPAHHALNTLDMATFGASATGPLNMAKANAALAFDPVVSKNFKSSNLVGGFSGDINELKANAGKAKVLEDIPSDKFNGDRVALGSWYQFYNQKANKDLMQKYGISEKDFIHAMIQGDQRFDQILKAENRDLMAEAWGHMSESVSDVLGIDPYRLNRIQLAAKSPAIGIFLNQPARVSRMMMKYLAEGNFKAMATFIGSVAAIGGSAVIPPSVKTAWGAIDPEGMYTASEALDSNSISGRLGRPLSKKMEWDYLWPVFAANLPLGEDIKKGVGETPQKVAHKTMEYLAEASSNPKKAEKLLPDLAKTFATAGTVYSAVLAQPRVGPVPIRFGTKAARAYANATEGGKPIYPDEIIDGGLQPRPKTMKFKDIDVDPNEQYADQFLPGMNMYELQSSRHQSEVKAIKEQAQRIQAAEKLSRGTPLNPFFKELSARQKQTKPAYSAKYKEPNRSPFHLIEGLNGTQRKIK
jgi:hypothetical protein